MASIAPIDIVDLTERSTDNLVLIQQAFAIEAGQKFSGANWPTQITRAAWRKRYLVQEVAATLASGPAYIADPLLSCAQVHAAAAWSAADPHANLNPTLAAALERGDLIASDNEGFLPWSGQDKTVVVVPEEGAYGETPTSGWYGTGEGPQPE
jgi:hypothetical protein